MYKDEFNGSKAYIEAVGRIGQATDSFEKKYEDNKSEKYEKYKDQDTTYAGTSIGLGFKQKLAQTIGIEENVRYMFAHKKGKDIEYKEGAIAKFDDVASKRIGAQVKVTANNTGWIKPYMGLGYEYELDGQVSAKIKDAGDDLGKMPPTDFRGHTGTLELGANIKASKKIDINLSGQGFVGKRTGLAGMLKLKYAFCGFGKQANAQDPQVSQQNTDVK